MKGLSKVYKRSEIFPEPEWEALVEKLFNHKGTVFLMGATSSGKSTLARYLIEKLLSKDAVIFLIDSDIGQSSQRSREARIRYRRERFNVALGDINVYE